MLTLGPPCWNGLYAAGALPTGFAAAEESGPPPGGSHSDSDSDHKEIRP
ncbi:hypothetical protein ABZY57_16070 [Streptomyces sp. NPDC006450]